MKVKRSITRRNFAERRPGVRGHHSAAAARPRGLRRAFAQRRTHEGDRRRGRHGLRHIGMPGAAIVSATSTPPTRAGVTMSPEGTKGYRDFREVLERPDVDIVHVLTPLHWYYIITIAAAEAGKDVWCENP